MAVSEDDVLVRSLLAAASGGLPVPPGLEPEVLRGRARALRRRRRIGVAAAVTVVVAGGALAVGLPRALPSGRHTAPVDRTVRPSPSTPLAALTALLPPADRDVVRVAPVVQNGEVFDSPDGTAQPSGVTAHPLNGWYALRQDGGVGLLRIDIVPASLAAAEVWPGCTPSGRERPGYSCHTTVLPDHSEATVSAAPSVPDGAGSSAQTLGASVSVDIAYLDGRHLDLTAYAGSSGPHSHGPVLGAPPLTAAQLLALAGKPLWWQ